MVQRLRVGIIGLGRVAWLLEQDPLEQHPCTHVGAWVSRTDIQLVAGCDIDEERCHAFVAAYPDSRCYTDYRRMLAEERLDCVSICAYATERKAMILAALEFGVRGIWAEKALACSLAEIDAIEAAVNSANIPLTVSYMRRWGADYRQVQTAVAASEIGRLQTITAQFSGNLLHTGTHALDVLTMLAGPARRVRGWLERGAGRVQDSGYRYQGKDTADEIKDVGGHAVIEYDKNVFGFVQGQARNYFWFEFELQGSQGLIRIGNEQFELWRRAASRRHSGFHELRRDDVFTRPSGNVWQQACAELVAAIREGATISCGVPEARYALATALGIHASARQGSVPLTLDEVDPQLYVESR